jgi:predicted MPP superfamily phosphohydrolase
MDRMLPYVERQLIYCAASGVTTLAAWVLLGRSARLAAAPRLRALCAALALAVPTAGWMLGARLLDDWHSTYQFIGVAHGFYVGVLWLPLAALTSARRHRRRTGSGRDWPLAATCVALWAVGAYALFVEPNRISVDRQRVTLEAWPADAPPLALVHISDLQTVGPCARNDRAAELINALAPDVIVVTGDYAAGPFAEPGETDPGVAEARSFLGKLRPRLALVCVEGHSEHGAHRREIFAGLERTYLDDQELELDLGDGRRLRIFGASVGGDLAEFAPRAEPGLATLFASHVPDVTRELDGLGIDLHLAGHTHGGQVALPFVGAPLTLSNLPRRYARGLHRFGDHWLNVSAGIGMEGNHAPRFRFLCPPEIDLIELAGSGPRNSGGSGPGP